MYPLTPEARPLLLPMLRVEVDASRELLINGRTLFGVGMDGNIVSASLKAIISGLLRSQSGLGQPTPYGATIAV